MSATQSTIDALMYSLRAGVGVLSQQDVRRRLAGLSEQQAKEICEQLQRRKVAKSWSVGEVEQLVGVWMEVRHG